MYRELKQQGFTLIELLVMLVVAAVMLFVAVPSLVSYMRLTRLSNAAQDLYYTMQYARSEAVKRNTNVFVSYVTGTNWCYGVSTAAACTCSTAGNCNLGATSAPDTTSSTLSASGFTGTSVRFEPIHGAANAAGLITFTQVGSTPAVSVRVRLFGSLLLCSANVTGYPVCT